MPGSATSTMKHKPGTLKAFASLRFRGDNLDPEKLSDLLATAPTTAYRKGDVYKRSGGQEARGRTGLWLLSSDGRVAGADLESHLRYLLHVLLPSGSDDRLERLHQLMREEQLDADVSCFWYGEAGARPPKIADEVRRALARVPARLETDFDTD
jgi:hypothetical protein